jgi:hypothetical protein
MVKKFLTALVFLAPCVWAADLAPAPAAVPMNSFTGTVVSVDPDARVLRMSLEGGYNVEFTYDSKTSVKDKGAAITPGALSYGDRVVARYIGRDLYARQIERLDKDGVATPVAETPVAASATVAEATAVVSDSTPVASAGPTVQ